MPTFRLDRRAFLQGLAACLLLPEGISDAATLAPDVSDKTWKTMEESPIWFDVQAGGRIGDNRYQGPKTRAGVFDFSLREIKSPDDVLMYADTIQPFMWHLREQYEEFWGALSEREQELWPEEPEDSFGNGKEDAMHIWVKSRTDAEFAQMLDGAGEWLDSEPNYLNEENEYFTIPASGDDYAYQFFSRYFDGEAAELIGVVVVEGECPGSTYYAAELSVPIKEANRRAEEAGIPIRFNRAA